MKAVIDLSGIQWRYISDDGNAWISDQGPSSLQGDRVKNTEKRRVVRLPGFYAKEVNYRGIRRWLKTLFGGTACKEGRKSLLLEQMGISAPQVLAFGQESREGLILRDILITREVPDSKRFYDVIFDEYRNYSFMEKVNLIRDFAEFIHQIHQAGIMHHDLHIGNILIRKDDQKNRFFLLDTDRIQFFSGSLSPRNKAKNLSLLLINFQQLSTRTERFRFLKCYSNLDEKGRVDAWFLAEVKKNALRQTLKTTHKRALRSLANNTHFASRKRDGFSAFFQKASPAMDALNALLPDPDAVLNTGEVLKAGRTVQAAVVVLGGRKYFLKRYNDKGFFYQVRNAFRKSRAVRTWLVSWEFFFRGLPVPKPVLCLEQRSFRLLKKSYILYEYVNNSIPLSQKWPLLDTDERKTVLVRLGIKLGLMHQSGGIHGDLKWNNILIDEDNHIYFIDFDGSRISFSCRSFKIAKDIDRFLKDLSKYERNESVKFSFLKVFSKWH
jgi:tRNA A-37 threonylcarbamoyl transferase component Bud32